MFVISNLYFVLSTEEKYVFVFNNAKAQNIRINVFNRIKCSWFGPIIKTYFAQKLYLITLKYVMGSQTNAPCI